MSDPRRFADLSPEEADLFRSLNRDLPPPASLEDRTVAALRQRDLLRPTTPSPALGPRIRLVAASLILAALSFLAGRGSAPAPATPDTAPSPPTVIAEDSPAFMLLLYDPADTPFDSERANRQFVEYSAWAEELRAEGRLVDANPLADDGHLLRQLDGRVADTAGAEPGASWVLGGYFTIRAQNEDDARAIARDCPHLRYDGTVAVRAVGH